MSLRKNRPKIAKNAAQPFFGQNKCITLTQEKVAQK
jgi:hypothetical protein